MDRDPRVIAEEVVAEALATPPVTYSCDCGDPYCIFATETGGER